MTTKLCLLALLLVTLSVIKVPSASAEGIGFFPSEITVNDALRGQRYVAGTVIINQTAQPRLFRLSGDGDIKSWLSFAVEGAPDTPVTEVTAQPNSQARLVVYIKIPDTTVNGSYKGELLMENFPMEGQSSDAIQALRQGITVSVSGTQKLSLGVGSPLADPKIEAGKPFRVKLQVSNQSNLDVAPVVALTVNGVGADGAVAPSAAANLRIEGEKIAAGHEGEVASSWDTAGQSIGHYRATLTVGAQGQEFGVRAVDFDIVPAGSLTRGGSIRAMSLVGAPPVGSIARVDVTFDNKGETEVQAKFVGQVYLNGAIVSETESKIGATAQPNGSAVISTFFPVNKAGKYTLRGKVQYESAQTEESVFEFTVGNASTSKSNLLMPFGLGLGVVALMGGGVGLMLQRRRSGTRA